MITTLLELVRFRRGVSYRSEDLQEGAATLLGLRSIVSGSRFAVATEGLPYDGPFKPENVATPDSLLIAITDLTQTGEVIGTAALAPPNRGLDLASLDVVIADVNPDLVDRRWLLYRLRCSDYKAFVRGAATGTTVRHLSPQLLGRFVLNVPELSVQKATADFLGALDDKIELNLRLSTTLEDLARAHFASTFGLLDPGRLPVGWTVATLGEHVELTRGLSYNGAGLADDGIPLHNLDSIANAGGYSYKGLKHYRGDYKPRHIARGGDLLVVNTDLTWALQRIAQPAIVPKRFGDLTLFSHHLYRLRPKPSSTLTTTFLYLALMSPRLRQVIVGYSNGTTVNMLPADSMQRPRVAVPPAELVQRFDRTLVPLFSEKEHLQIESETLAELRDLLIPRLMSGQVGPVESWTVAAEAL